MKLESFIEEVNSIQNPPDKKVFLSMLIDRKLSHMEKVYQDKAIKYLSKLKAEIKDRDLASLAKSLALLAKDSNARLFMILDNLAELASD